jgi:hypothetical protein
MDANIETVRIPIVIEQRHINNGQQEDGYIFFRSLTCPLTLAGKETIPRLNMITPTTAVFLQSLLGLREKAIIVPLPDDAKEFVRRADDAYPSNKVEPCTVHLDVPKVLIP